MDANSTVWLKDKTKVVRMPGDNSAIFFNYVRPFYHDTLPISGARVEQQTTMPAELYVFHGELQGSQFKHMLLYATVVFCKGSKWKHVLSRLLDDYPALCRYHSL
jgi:hypothetical protein